MFKIGNVEIRKPIIVAPMAGISNGAFRELCYKFGAGMTCCEMVSDKAIYYKNKKTYDMLEVDDAFHPISLQLFGYDIDTMVYAAKVLDKQTNADIIDINMGCPVNKVLKAKAGSYLMKEADHAIKMVEEVVRNVNKPVTVKMRLGYDNKHINYLELAKGLEEVGVQAITLHARTRTQMYEGKADWSHIKILKENLSIPVIGNGDVKSVEDFIKMKNETGVDAVMIGRALVGNPFLIKEINNYLNKKDNYEISYEERFESLLDHTIKLIDLKGERVGIREMRGLAPHYISGLYMSTKYKNKMNSMSSYQELLDILDEYKKLLESRD